MISGVNSRKTMNSGVQRSVLAQDSYMNMNSLFIYEFMKNHEFIYEFMKKTYELGCTKKGFVEKFIYMNSYMDSYSHM